jgi:tRNA pseudouridine38-40 synthase
VKRYLIEISFNGTNYHGWQIQNNAITIQEKIQDALNSIVKELSNCSIVGCGRTDTGVHAEQFFFHVDLPEINDDEKFVYHLNQILPNDIYVKKCIHVSDDFHARFSAISRTYEYKIHQQKNPFNQSLSTYVGYSLDVDLMNQCSQLLLKYKDFTSFSKVHTDVNNFNCDISEAKWDQKEAQLVFTVTANRFLRNMVRAIVGTMILVGKRKMDSKKFCSIIEAKNRSMAGPSVLAKGLFLKNIEYPEL